MLHLGFFGINYHLWFQYVNSAGVSMGLWEYPYELTSFQPSFTLDGSIAPVAFMLVYQWTLNHGKNVFLYSLLLSALFGFVMKPMMAYFDFSICLVVFIIFIYFCFMKHFCCFLFNYKAVFMDATKIWKEKIDNGKPSTNLKKKEPPLLGGSPLSLIFHPLFPLMLLG